MRHLLSICDRFAPGLRKCFLIASVRAALVCLVVWLATLCVAQSSAPYQKHTPPTKQQKKARRSSSPTRSRSRRRASSATLASRCARCVFFVRGDEAILVCCSVRRSLKPQTPNKNAHTTQKTKQRGHIHHIDNGFGFDQRFPYRVPHIDGLYSASAGAHPAGSVIGCAGHNAAGVLVRDLGLVPKWATAAE